MIFSECILCNSTTPTQVALCLACMKDLGQEMHARSIDTEKLRFSHSSEILEIISFANYGPLVRKLVRILKTQPFGVMAPLLDSLISTWVDHWNLEICKRFEFDGVVAAPGNPMRVLLQTNLGYVIAKKLSQTSRSCNLSHILRARFQVHSLSPQKYLNRKSRQDPQRKLRFKICHEHAKPFPSGTRVLLVDDICATGATLEHCHLALTRAGFKVIGGVVMARVAGTSTPQNFRALENLA